MKQVNQTIKTGSQMSIVLNFTQYTELLLRKPFKSEICLLLDYLYIYNSVSFVIMDNCFGIGNMALSLSLYPYNKNLSWHQNTLILT